MKQIFSKKAISPVVAIALLLVVAVTAVVGFQAFFKNYQSQIFTDVEQKSIIQEIAQIQDLIGNSIYIKNKGENLTISQIKIGKNICNFTNSNLSLGISEIELEDCQVSSGVQNVMILTNKGILEKKFFIENGNFKENSQSNPSQNPTNQNCNFNSNSVNHGASVTAFKESQVITPNSCESETRICNNGVLSGSFEHSSCEQIQQKKYFLSFLNGSKTDAGISLIQDDNQNFLITGYTYTFGTNGQDLMLTKFTQNGEEIWTKILDNPKISNSYFDGVKIIKDIDNNFLITGTTNLYNSNVNLFLTKFNQNGEEVWTKIINGSEADYGRDVIQTNNGDTFLTGIFRSYPEYNNYKSQILLSKFNQNGEEVWTKLIGSAFEDYGVNLINTKDNHLAILGYSQALDNGQNWRIFLTKLDINANQIWTKFFNFESYAVSFIETSDLGFLIIGYDGQNSNKYIVSKISSSGNVVWTKRVNLDQQNHFSQAIETYDNGFVLVGKTSNFGGSDYDILIVKLSSSGDVVWSKIVDGTNYDNAVSVLELEDNSLVLTGITQSFGESDSDLFLLKLNSSGSSENFSQLVDINFLFENINLNLNDVSFAVNDFQILEKDVQISQIDIDTNSEFVFYE